MFLCPVCTPSSESSPAGVGEAELQCTRAWLQGQLLTGDAKVDGRTCLCFETDPYADVPDVSRKTRRFYFYRTIALRLGAAHGRVKLPRCVELQIESLYGRSTTGFKPY